MSENIRVLIVEDELADAELMVRELRRAGFAPDWARVDTELEYLSSLDWAPDVILSDSNLPSFDGLQALEILRERDLDIPFILVSGRLGEDWAVDAMKRGAYDYLLKDRLARLGESVRRALSQRQLRAERALAIEALRQSEERHRLVSEITADYAYSLDAPSGQPLACAWITEPFTRITGFTAPEINLRGWESLYHAEDRLIAEQHYRILISNQSHSFEARILTKEEQVRWVRVHGSPIWDDAQSRVVSVFGAAQDITAQKQLEQQLLQSQKMEAIGRLAGGVAHDFNNLLTVIVSHCSMALEELNPRDTIYQRIDDVLKAGEQAAALTHQLLAFSRKQVLQPRVVNLAATLEEMDRMIRRLIGEDIQVMTLIDESLAQVRIDPNQIQQVILNLVVNARDAMPRGGKLTLELKNAEVDGFHPHKHAVPFGRYVSLVVSDNGIGMTPDVQQRVFEPFFSTKEVGRGTGLGLATVYGIVRQSNGYIWLYSEPDIGTTFKVFLPRVDEEPDRAAADRVLQRIGGDETVLLVEDDAAVRSLAAEILASAGYKVFIAENSDEALSASNQYPGEIHLLVTDVVLQKMSGRQIAQRLIADRPHMRVLFMSGYTGDAIDHHGILDANVHFLQKPFAPGALCAKVRAVLNAGHVRA